MLDVIAFKIIQKFAKHFVMGVVTWQLLERQCVRLGYFGGKLAAGAAGDVLLSHTEGISSRAAAEAQDHRRIYKAH